MATLEELRQQYYANLFKTSEDYVRDLPPLPSETVEPISGAEKQALKLARESVADRPEFLNMGVGSLGQASLSAANAATQAQQSTGMFDPSTIQQFQNPFQQQVIDEYTKEMQRQFNVQQAGRDAAAVQRGAFSGDRRDVLDAEAATGFQRQLGQGIAGLLSSGFQQAQRTAQQAFENQQRRGQLAAQNLANIGRLQTGVGQVFGQFDPIASGVLERDVSTLARIGATERGIGQAERAAEFQNLQRQYLQPQQALSFQSGILGAFPTYAESQAQQTFNPLFTGIQSLFG
jgi:hypothetical protein